MWKKIKGASYYEVNELGQVRSLDKTKVRWNGVAYCKITYKGRELKFKDIRGYKNVSIVYDNGDRKTKQVHRLVLETFKPNENQNTLQVNHINGIKDDNRLENLEWCTSLENVRHSHIIKPNRKKRNQSGEKNNLSKLNDENVIQILSMIKEGYTTREIGEKFGVKGNTISNISTGKTWKHIPR